MADATRFKKQKRTTMQYVSQEFSWGRVKGSQEADFVKAHKEKMAIYCPQGSGTLRQQQRPKKSELSGWQLSARKNFPDEVRKL